MVVVVGSKDTHKEYSYEEILKHSKELDGICRCEEGIDVRTKRANDEKGSLEEVLRISINVEEAYE